MNSLAREVAARAALGEPSVRVRVPGVHREPNEFDDLPEELPDASVGWTENPEHAQ